VVLNARVIPVGAEGGFWWSSVSNGLCKRTLLYGGRLDVQNGRSAPFGPFSIYWWWSSCGRSWGWKHAQSGGAKQEWERTSRCGPWPGALARARSTWGVTGSSRQLRLRACGLLNFERAATNGHRWEPEDRFRTSRRQFIFELANCAR
jgi:hypothetical protein